MAERILVRKVEAGLWQWRPVTSHNQWVSESFYTGDINLLTESIVGKTCWLILDGRNVVTQQVDVGVKDRKVLPKLVPFQVEESVVTPIDDLTFTYGPLVDGVVTAAYTNHASAHAQIAALEEVSADVQSVLCDYLELDAGDGWVFLLDGPRFYAKCGSYQGFSCEAENAELFLKSFFAQFKESKNELPAVVHLVSDTPEGLTQLREYLPEDIENSDLTSIHEQDGSFWDVLKLQSKPVLEFRTGNLARKLPFGQWWSDWKVPAIAASIAFVLAVGTTWGELHKAKLISKALFADRNDVFRQVVPTGSISDPVIQLKSKLNKISDTESSNLVYLVSKVAPEIQKNSDLKVTSFRYTQNNGTLQFNVEAKDFAMLEALQNKISENGLVAEIKSSRVTGDIHQAQLKVTGS